MLKDPAVQGNPLFDPVRETAALRNRVSRGVGTTLQNQFAPASTLIPARTLLSLLTLNLLTSVNVTVLQAHPIARVTEAAPMFVV